MLVRLLLVMEYLVVQVVVHVEDLVELHLVVMVTLQAHLLHKVIMVDLQKMELLVIDQEVVVEVLVQLVLILNLQ